MRDAQLVRRAWELGAELDPGEVDETEQIRVITRALIGAPRHSAIAARVVAAAIRDAGWRITRT